jgi:hypothetical protein
MNFTRKGDLYIPDEEPIAKGRSMVGYSRRSFFGLLAAFAATPNVTRLPFHPITAVSVLSVNIGNEANPKWIEVGRIQDFKLTFNDIFNAKGRLNRSLLNLTPRHFSVSGHFVKSARIAR